MNIEMKIFSLDYCLIVQLANFMLKKPESEASDFPSISKNIIKYRRNESCNAKQIVFNDIRLII